MSRRTLSLKVLSQISFCLREVKGSKTVTVVGDLHGKLDDLLVILYKVRNYSMLPSIDNSNRLIPERFTIAHQLLRFQRRLCRSRQEELGSSSHSSLLLHDLSRLCDVESWQSRRCCDESPLWVHARGSPEVSAQRRSAAEVDRSGLSALAARHAYQQQDLRGARWNIGDD